MHRFECLGFRFLIFSNYCSAIYWGNVWTKLMTPISGITIWVRKCIISLLCPNGDLPTLEGEKSEALVLWSFRSTCIWKHNSERVWRPSPPHNRHAGCCHRDHHPHSGKPQPNYRDGSNFNASSKVYANAGRPA